MGLHMRLKSNEQSKCAIKIPRYHWFCNVAMRIYKEHSQKPSLTVLLITSKNKSFLCFNTRGYKPDIVQV